jgi:cell wall-associated NlpC family hydrolase
MKELLLIGTTVLALTTGGVTVGSANTGTTQPHIRGSHTSVALLDKAELIAQAQEDMLEQIALQEETDRVNGVIEELKTHVGKTWYVFSGNTPSGWDCSGLTMWFYQQLGIELEHRASKQESAGTKVSDPKPGDLVVFKYNGNKSAYHVGIYIGNGEMIHAPKHGHVTRVENIKTFAGNYSEVSYARFIETL